MTVDKIGSFQILEVLHGGAQTLFRARAADGRMVAIKAVSLANLTPETRERFTREAETCRTLDHPNLVRVFEMGEAGGMLYQAMELLEGADLGEAMSSGRAFSWDEKLSIMEQVCAGLQYAHDHRLVHRDIKPANLFLEKSGTVRVLDFGMVRVAESELTRAGSSLGTLNFMSPEQIRGERCTAASDVFSAGIVFFQLASGRHPFSARDRTLAQVVSAIVFEPAPKLKGLCPDAPEGLEFILGRALEKDPSRRLQTGGELRQALSLCRVTRELGAAAAPQISAADGGAPRMMRAQPAPEWDAEKTRVLQRPRAAAGDAEKTRVVVRPVPSAPVQKPAEAPKTEAGPAWRYCASCTTRNEPGTTICIQCGAPLGGRAAAAKSSQTALYLAIAVAVVLGLALAAVLIFR